MGESVRSLANDLGVKRVRFKPLLPIDRASKLDEPVKSEELIEYMKVNGMLKSEIHHLAICESQLKIFMNRY